MTKSEEMERQEVREKIADLVAKRRYNYKENGICVTTGKDYDVADQILALISPDQTMELNQQIVELKAEITDYKNQSTLTYCVYCGTSFPLDNEAGEKVTEHIKTCEKHPLYQANQRVKELESELDQTAREIFEEIEKVAQVRTSDNAILIFKKNWQSLKVHYLK